MDTNEQELVPKDRRGVTRDVTGTADRLILIRADAGTEIGGGHIMRCLALAHEWTRQGGKVVFISHCATDGLRSRIIESGAHLIPIEKAHPHPSDMETLKSLFNSGQFRTLEDTRPWVALDGYHFDEEYHSRIRKLGYRLAVIDDMAHLRFYDADIIINQNMHAESLTYHCPRHTRQLLGTQYVMLRPEFLRYQEWKREIPETANKILVTMGASDPENATLTVLQALDNLDSSDLHIKVVVGPSNPHAAILQASSRCHVSRVELISDSKDMPRLMAWADLAVSAAGSTVWELAFMGTPSFLLPLADNQVPIAHAAAGLGASTESMVEGRRHFRKHEIETLHGLIQSSVLRKAGMAFGKSRVDGLGVSRVAVVLAQVNQ